MFLSSFKSKLIYALINILFVIPYIYSLFVFFHNNSERLIVFSLYIFWTISLIFFGYLSNRRNILLKKDLENKNNVLQGLLDSIPDIIFFKDINGVYLGCNPSFAEFVGKPQHKITGKTDYNLFLKEEADFFREQDTIMMESNQPRHNEEWINYPDGRQILLETIKAPLYDINGEVIGLLGVSRDITDRKKMELSLIEKQYQLNAILDNIPFLAWMKDKDGKFLAVNKLYAEACRHSPEEIIGRTDMAIWPDDLAEQYMDDDREVIKSGRKKEIQELVDYPNGRIWMEAFKSPVKTERGEIIGTVGLAKDITDRKLFQEKMLLKDKLLTAVGESINELVKNHDFNDAIIKAFNLIGNAMDVDRIHLFENSYNTELDDYEISQIHEWVSQSAIPIINNPILKNLSVKTMGTYGDMLKQNIPVISLIKDLNLTTREHFKPLNILSLMIFPIFIEENFWGFISIDECKTERIWTEPEQAILSSFAVSIAGVIEKNLQKEQEKNRIKKELKIALKHSNLGLWYWNIKTNQVDFSDRLVEMLEYKLDEVDSNLSVWESWILEEDKERVRNAIQSYLEGRTDKYELEYRVKTKSGDIKWILGQGEIIERDQYNTPLIMTGTHIDITERKKMNELLLQNEKMISVGELAAGMAHEINNPISGIMYGCENILLRISPDITLNNEIAKECGTNINSLIKYFKKRELMRSLNEMNAASEKVSKIVNDMLSFSRKSNTTMQKESLAEILDKSVGLASNDFNLNKKYDFRKIEIVRNYRQISEIACKKIELEQVFVNLIRNAAQSMQVENLNPRIILRCYEHSNFIRIEVEDNGSGMDDIIKKRIFEPFFTTKEVGIGTGLGLSVSYFIITNTHKGKITVESTLGKGTKFIVDLPIT